MLNALYILLAPKNNPNWNGEIAVLKTKAEMYWYTDGIIDIKKLGVDFIIIFEEELIEKGFKNPIIFIILKNKNKQIKILDIENDSNTIHPSSGERTKKMIDKKAKVRNIIFDSAKKDIFSIPWKNQVGERPWNIPPITTINK